MFIRRYCVSDSGSALAIAALMFPVILGMAGAGVDISNWVMTRHHMQAAADAAALAGAWELANGGTTAAAEAAALREAQNNGYDPALSGTLDVTVATDADGTRTVRADISQKAETWFASIFMNSDVIVATTATAEELAGGPFCVLGLDQTAIGAVEATGSVVIDSEACGIAVNSSSSSALELIGNASVNVGEVRIVGDYSATGHSDLTYNKLRTNAAPTADPYEDLTIDAFAGCTNAQQRSGPTRYNSNATLNPGVYCGGITITGNNTIVMNPGTYIMDGGSFNVSGGGSITGDGVTIILTNSGGSSYGSYGSISMSGGKDMLIKAPTTGAYAGIAIYQDRNTPASCTNTVTGTAGVEIQGAAYFPACQFNFGGNSGVSPSGSSLCTKLIAKQVLFYGNPTMGNSCAGTGTRDIGNSSARLVL